LDDLRASADVPAPLTPARKSGSGGLTVDHLIGWAWILGREGGGTPPHAPTVLGGGLRVSYRLPCTYMLSRAGADSVACWAFDNWDPSRTQAGNFHFGDVLDDELITVTARTRINGPEQVHSVSDRTGGFLVFAYSSQGGRGILTEVASIWVEGATGTVLASDGVAVSVERTATGLYTSTLASGTFQVATTNQLSTTDAATGTPVIVWSGKTSSTTLGTRSVNTAGVNTDGDFLLRFYR
jgi:hypothetical protein